MATTPDTPPTPGTPAGVAHPPQDDAAPASAPLTPARKGAIFVPVVIAWLFVVFDGYDLIVYGTVQGALLEEWSLTPAQGGTLGSVAFLGMMIGALLVGRLSDTIGRKRAIIGSAIVLSIFTAGCALVHDPVSFGALRFLAGLGLGGLVPSANALAADLVPRRWRASVATLMMSGVPLGGSIAALLGIGVIPNHGWRPMFWVALIPLLVLVPLAWAKLPDQRPTGLPTETKAGFVTLLRAPYLGISILFAVATVATLMAWYGLGTWLPRLMQTAGYDLGSALTFALALNLGAIAGSVVTAWAGDKVGTIPTAFAAAGLAGLSLMALLMHPPTGAIYVILVFAGVGTHGTQCLIIAAIATYFPESLRGTALGWGLGVGRIGAVAAPQIGGLLLSAGLGVNSNFLLFGGCALVAAVVLAGIWANFGATHDEVRRIRK